MAMNKSIEMARDNIFMIAYEIECLVPPREMPLEYAAEWAELFKHELSKARKAVMAYVFAVEDARMAQMEASASTPTVQGVSGS